MFLISILKKAFGFGVMPKLASLVNLLLLPLITPFLTPFDYGIWGVITSYSGLFITIAPLGLNLFLSNNLTVRLSPSNDGVYPFLPIL